MPLNDEEHLLLQDSLQRFIADNYTDMHRRSAVANPIGFSPDNWRIFSQFGWVGIGIGTEFGGSGGSLRDICLMMNHAGRALITEPLLESAVLGAWLIEHSDAAHLKSAWLSAIVEGRLLVSLAHCEPDAGFDRQWVTTTATDTGQGFLLTGMKAPVFHGPSANIFLVSARSIGRQQLSLFALDRDMPGVRIESAIGVDGTPQSKLHLENVLLPTERRIAVDAKPLLDAAMNRAALAVCSKSLGTMGAALTGTLDYVRNRRQFGRTLGEMQTVRHRLVDMHISFTEASALTSAAIDLHDCGSQALDRAVSAARVSVIRAGQQIGEQSIQLHGGMGMTDSITIGHFYKSLLAASPLFGDAEWHLDRLASTP